LEGQMSSVLADRDGKPSCRLAFEPPAGLQSSATSAALNHVPKGSGAKAPGRAAAQETDMRNDRTGTDCHPDHIHELTC
jgi:hypothetical protein